MTSALVHVVLGNGRLVRSRILLDTCSTANFITENLAKSLKIPMKRCSLPIGALNSLSTSTKYIITIKFRSIHNKFEKKVDFLTIPKIAGLIPSEPIPREQLSIPRNLPLADPKFHLPAEINMLLGCGPSLSLFSVGQLNVSKDNSDIFLQKTRLGWVVGGNFGSAKTVNPISCKYTNLEELISKFWEVEEVNTIDNKSTENSDIESHFKKFTFRDETGRFVVALPFKKSPDCLGDSRSQAYNQLLSLQRKFKKNPELYREYNSVITEYINRGYIKKVHYPNDNPCFYLPHHAVLKETSATTKVRVVFNGSAKSTSGVSDL